ncbi:MAG: hypothetical protein JXR37_17540 [Kiritimatiellae bacterium]|nr:hypothetical protein [Kiritimatiellia bacterium]
MIRSRDAVHAGPRGDLSAIYHVVYPNEGFEESAQALFRLVERAQEIGPGRPRSLILDIEGHRDNARRFDRDMRERQEDFVLGFLSRYLSEIHIPVFSGTNPGKQDDVLPASLDIQAPG